MRWIIGDIHGMLKPLQRLISTIYDADPAPQFFFAGDYVNRGEYSRGVIDLLLALPSAKFVRGNHDDVFDLVINGQMYEKIVSDDERVDMYTFFLQQGLDNTLLSYGLTWDEIELFGKRSRGEAMKQINALSRKIPTSHGQFIRTLPSVIEEPEFFVAHGKIDGDDASPHGTLTSHIDREATRRQLLLWGRYTSAEIAAPKKWPKLGYFGHTPTIGYPDLADANEPAVIAGNGMRLVDTGCAMVPRGRLSAVCHETQEIVQVDRNLHVHRPKATVADGSAPADEPPAE